MGVVKTVNPVLVSKDVRFLESGKKILVFWQDRSMNGVFGRSDIF